MTTTDVKERKAVEAKPNYRTNKADLPVRRARPSAAARDDVMLAVQLAYGNETSFMFAERGPDYHTRPHQHDAEQMNYIISGEIWFYVDGRGYRCGPGDVMRIPKNKVHWAWNRGNENAVLIETHSPPLIGNNAEARALSVPLLGPSEDKEKVPYVVNVVVPMDPKDVAAIEQRAWDEEGD
jgi:mannose-6-phosphate isomerase-like protein (cupin superfamily)